MRCEGCGHSIEKHAFSDPKACVYGVEPCDCEGFVYPGFGPFTELPEGATPTNIPKDQEGLA